MFGLEPPRIIPRLYRGKTENGIGKGREKRFRGGRSQPRVPGASLRIAFSPFSSGVEP